VNKGLAIGVAIGIAIAAIAGAYAFFGIQLDESPGGSTGIGVGDKADVTVQPPSEAEESSEGGEEKMGIKDVGEVETEEPPKISVSAKENIGFKEETP